MATLEMEVCIVATLGQSHVTLRKITLHSSENGC